MPGTDQRPGELFSYVDLEKRVRRGHPLRAARELANAALADFSADFAGLYSGIGRPSIPPEKLLRAPSCYRGNVADKRFDLHRLAVAASPGNSESGRSDGWACDG